ncbi:MAG TPA: hypothetical protein VGE13_00425 [Candidatus Saccharimonadales bacterium]
MSRTHNTLQKGFGAIEILIVIAVVIILGFLGWKAWEAYTDKPSDTSNQESKQQNNTMPSESDIPTIESESDLDKAEKMLDDTDIDGTESKDLESQTNL